MQEKPEMKDVKRRRLKKTKCTSSLNLSISPFTFSQVMFTCISHLFFTSLVEKKRKSMHRKKNILEILFSQKNSLSSQECLLLYCLFLHEKNGEWQEDVQYCCLPLERYPDPQNKYRQETEGQDNLQADIKCNINDTDSVSSPPLMSLWLEEEIVSPEDKIHRENESEKKRHTWIHAPSWSWSSSVLSASTLPKTSFILPGNSRPLHETRQEWR